MADEPQIESGEHRNTGEILDIRFQKNPNQKLKYLEAEPKILGVTQIALAVFLISINVGFDENSLEMFSWTVNCITFMIIIIAGSLAIAAQNLHLPTLKACLGMQAVACSGSVISIFLQINIFQSEFYCSMHEEESSLKTICLNTQIVSENYLALHKLVMAVHIALSATLAAFCCKVVQCCSPVSSVPVITVIRPPDLS